MFGILHHPLIPQARPMAEDVAAWLTAYGQKSWLGSIEDADDQADKIAQSQLLIALGGDGSVLHTARVAAIVKVPVFSINLGKLGFLTEANLDDWQQRLQKYLDGEFRLEKRLMLQASVERNDKSVAEILALNEIVIGRCEQVRVVRFQLFVDGDFVAAYTADSLITATPTGSTAYAMAAGGPIMPPELPNFMVLPVAPHLSLDRALVLHDAAEIVIRPIFDHSAIINGDGQNSITLETGDFIRIRRSPFDSLFVRIEDSSYFYRRLNARGGGLRGDLRSL